MTLTTGRIKIMHSLSAFSNSDANVSCNAARILQWISLSNINSSFDRVLHVQLMTLQGTGCVKCQPHVKGQDPRVVGRQPASKTQTWVCRNHKYWTLLRVWYYVGEPCSTILIARYNKVLYSLCRAVSNRPPTHREIKNCRHKTAAERSSILSLFCFGARRCKGHNIIPQLFDSTNDKAIATSTTRAVKMATTMIYETTSVTLVGGNGFVHALTWGDVMFVPCLLWRSTALSFVLSSQRIFLLLRNSSSDHMLSIFTSCLYRLPRMENAFLYLRMLLPCPNLSRMPWVATREMMT